MSVLSPKQAVCDGNEGHSGVFNITDFVFSHLGFCSCACGNTFLGGPEVTEAAAVSKAHALQPVGVLLCSLPRFPWKVLCGMNHEPWPGA